MKIGAVKNLSVGDKITEICITKYLVHLLSALITRCRFLLVREKHIR